MPLTLRATKGSKLTITEMDSNLTYLDTKTAYSGSFTGTAISGSLKLNATASYAPDWAASDGTIVPATISGVSYLYMSMGGTWTSRSFA